MARFGGRALATIIFAAGALPSASGGCSGSGNAGFISGAEGGGGIQFFDRTPGNLRQTMYAPKPGSASEDGGSGGSRTVVSKERNAQAGVARVLVEPVR